MQLAGWPRERSHLTSWWVWPVSVAVAAGTAVGTSWARPRRSTPKSVISMSLPPGPARQRRYLRCRSPRPLSPAVHQTIVVVDVEGFGDPRRTNLHRVAVRRGVYRSLRGAFASSGVRWKDCYREDRGDGVLVLIPPHVPKNLLVVPFPRELATALQEHNEACPQEAQIRLRVAVHAGEVQHDDQGVASAAVNLAFRLLQADAVKSALAGSPGVLALIASGWFYEEVIQHDPASAPTLYRQVWVVVKETETSAWVSLPDHPSPLCSATTCLKERRRTSEESSGDFGTSTRTSESCLEEDWSGCSSRLPAGRYCPPAPWCAMTPPYSPAARKAPGRPPPRCSWPAMAGSCWRTTACYFAGWWW